MTGEHTGVVLPAADEGAVGISVSGGLATVDMKDLAAELGIHPGSPPGVLDSH